MTKEELLPFLTKVNDLFPTPLSKKIDLDVYTEKLINYADFSVYKEGNEIIGLVAGYISNSVDDKSYISMVSVLEEMQGKGIGKRVVADFIEKSAALGKKAVHLYAVRENTPAIKMYKSLGFSEWKIENERRPGDIHLIYKINNDDKSQKVFRDSRDSIY